MYFGRGPRSRERFGRPLDIRGSLSVVSKGLRCAGDCEAGHHCSLASRVFPVVLALELETPGAGPTVPLEIRRLIREMSIANPLWGAPCIHGELLKLGIADKGGLGKFGLGAAGPA